LCSTPCRRVEVDRNDRFCTCTSGGEGGDAGTRSEIDDMFVSNSLWIVEDITCESLSAAPAECPEGGCFAFSEGMTTLFEIDILTEQPEFEFGTERWPSKSEVGAKSTETLL